MRLESSVRWIVMTIMTSKRQQPRAAPGTRNAAKRTRGDRPRESLVQSADVVRWPRRRSTPSRWGVFLVRRAPRIRRKSVTRFPDACGLVTRPRVAAYNPVEEGTGRVWEDLAIPAAQFLSSCGTFAGVAARAARGESQVHIPSPRRFPSCPVVVLEAVASPSYRSPFYSPFILFFIRHSLSLFMDFFPERAECARAHIHMHMYARGWEKCSRTNIFRSRQFLLNLISRGYEILKDEKVRRI